MTELGAPAASTDSEPWPADQVGRARQRLVESARERAPGLEDRLDARRDVADALDAVLACSRSLTRYLIAHPAAIDDLGDLDHRRPVDDTSVEGLVDWQRRELLRITARDLTGRDDLPVTGRLLAELAADVLAVADDLASASVAARVDRSRPTGAPGAATGTLAVIGMGKLAGRELNYASDVDVMFVGRGAMPVLERRARTLIAIARRCYRIDTNLRPQGRDGPLVRSVESFEAYWERWAEPWEFQALLKARPVAGDGELGERFMATAQRTLWSHPFAAEDLRSLRDLKRRAELEVARRGLADREIKQGRGGIRDIEFTVQLLQLVHGHLDPELRDPNTLATLRIMAEAGYVDPPDALQLGDAYRFLRVTEHRLQLEDERQTHTIPDTRDGLTHLARLVGFRDHARGSAAEQFRRQLLRHQNAVRSIHERVYFRPLLELFAERDRTLSPEAAATRLAAFGFTDAERTRMAIVELTRGLSRSSRLMQQLLPLILDWLSSTPNPDLGLLVLRNLVSGRERTVQLTEAFRDSPAVAQHLCLLAGTSRLLSDTFLHNPDLVARLPEEQRLLQRPRDELVASASDAISWRHDVAQQQAGLRRWKERQLLGIGARDVFGSADVARVGRELAVLAEATFEAALHSLRPTIPFCVVALGRFGGGELSYASDLDVVFVFDGGPHEADEAQRVASSVLRFIGGPFPAQQLYPVDASLRPEGKQGPLARSVQGFVHYWQRYALVWERQAMIRARPVAGDLALGARLLDALDPFVWADGLSDEDQREIRRMKARIERERIPFGEDPTFHLKLGRGSLSDVEFTAQLLQLTHGVRSPATMAALGLLSERTVLDDDDAELLMSSYRFCERTRNRWFLVNSKPGNSLPSAPDQLTWLARSLGRSPAGLREEYRRVTRRARRVVERVFYEQEG